MDFNRQFFKKKWPWVTLAILILVFFVIRNNWGVLGTREEGEGTKAPKADMESTFSLEGSAPERSGSEAEETPTDRPGEIVEANTPSPQEVVASPQKPNFTYSHTTRKLTVPLKEEPMLYIILQLELRYSEQSLKDEIEFKKKGIETLIQSRVSTKNKGELTAPILRSDIQNAMNEYLNAGEIGDVIFKDFKIEVKQK